MKHIIILCTAILLLTGCRAAATPAATVAPTTVVATATPAPTETPPPSPTIAPTDTAEPTATAEPSPTPRPSTTPRPTATPRPSPTIAPAPTLDLGLDDIEEIVDDGGFAFRPFLSGMEMDIQANEVAFADEAGTFVGSFNGFATDSTESLESLLSLSAQLMNENLPDADIQAGEPYPLTVGGVEGLAADLSGTLFGRPVRGQLLVARPSAEQFFNGFALGNTSGGDEIWTERGSALFDTLLDSVRFFPIAPVAAEATIAPTGASACPVATDESYGFTEANAIRVGGEAFGGPSRAEAYLDTLRGPAGQAVTYSRVGSQPFEETVLDAYELTYEGAAQGAILFVDQYAFETLYAPVGFTCAAPFPLTAP